MAPNPFRRRKPAPPYANALHAAEAALAMARTKAAGVTPTVKKAAPTIGKVAKVAAPIAAGLGVAGVVVKKVLGGRGGDGGGEAHQPIPVPPPGQSNYDAAGPVANTATPVPVPERRGASIEPIDEEAEIAAAAAEARAIGGSAGDDYVNSEGLAVDEAERPVFESGEGDAEGFEQAEAELEANAILEGDGMSDAERQIDEAIEEQSNPFAGERDDAIVEEAGEADSEGGQGQDR
jgi:hypothetical protein